MQPPGSEQTGEGPRATADVEDRARTKLLDKGHVNVEIRPIGVERIVDLGQARFLEQGVRHSKQ